MLKYLTMQAFLNVLLPDLCFGSDHEYFLCACAADNRLLEKSDLQAVLSERLQTDKYDQSRHDLR